MQVYERVSGNMKEMRVIMTSIFKTPFGENQQFVQNLHTAGFSYEDVVRVIKKPYLASLMYVAIQPTSSVQEVERQLDVWQNLGVDINEALYDSILQQADVFEPITDSDEPLVTGGFGYSNPKVIVNKLFGVFTPPDGYTKNNYIEDAELRYAPGMKPTGGLRLVHYEPNAYAGLSAEAARKAAKSDKVRLASIEVLEHLVLNPQSGLTLDGKRYYYPNLSGLQRKYGAVWSVVPFLVRWDDWNCGFCLHYSRSAGRAAGLWSSPVVREC
jgi:hypothetical protein